MRAPAILKSSSEGSAWVRRVLLSLAALIVLYLYSYSLVLAFGFALSRPPPQFWGRLIANPGSAALAWMVACHTAALLVVSLPFAYLIHRIYGSRAPSVAFIMTLVLFLGFALPALWQSFAGSPPSFKLVTTFDQIKLLGSLPLMTWAFGRLARRRVRPDFGAA
jgi:hypothetical protein